MLNVSLFLLQLAIIIASSQAVAWAFREVAQPHVVGQMVVGVALGPTVFGRPRTGRYHALFPASSLIWAQRDRRGGPGDLSVFGRRTRGLLR
jgi:Kef-type K+ transport system membrane component KefB